MALLLSISSSSRQAKSICLFHDHLQWHQITDLAYYPADKRLNYIFRHRQVILFHFVVCDVKYPYSSQTREPKECFVVKTLEIAAFYSPAVNKVWKCMQFFLS
jgi:hypothetical protein